MIGGIPQPTPYDLRFTLGGFPVRVSIWFWLGTLLFGSQLIGDPPVILMWIAACFLSILLHEMGHALAYRRYGVASHIVLYIFGGLAIPDTQANPWSLSTRQLDPRKSIFVSAAGPGVQLVLAAGIVAILLAGQYPLPGISGYLYNVVPPPLQFRRMPDNAYSFVYFMFVINVYWALLNLMPVYPLDGGRIARNMFLLNSGGDAVRQSLMLSMIVGGALAFYGLSSNNIWLGLLFGSLAFSNYQEYQMYSSGGFGGRPW